MERRLKQLKKRLFAIVRDADFTLKLIKERRAKRDVEAEYCRIIEELEDTIRFLSR